MFLAVAREVTAEHIETYKIDQEQDSPIGPAALLGKKISEIAEAMMNAKISLVNIGYSGRMSFEFSTVSPNSLLNSRASRLRSR